MSWQDRLSDLTAAGLRRRLREVSSAQTARIRLDGRDVVNFCSNNYLGLASDPRLAAAAEEALAEFGWGAGSAALISGQMSPHQTLKDRLREFFGSEDVLLFNSGYHANTGCIPALMDEDAVIFSDATNHASIIDGCRLSKAPLHIYRHGDMNHLEELLKQADGANQRWIVTETVFSMDGDLAPLAELTKLAQRFDAGLYLDEAHAVGVFGDGRGLWESAASDPRRRVARALSGPSVFQTQPGSCEATGPGAVAEATFPVVRIGTLGKAFGSYGAFVLASHEICEFLLNKARTFIYTTALPPAVAAVSARAIEIAATEPKHRDQLWQNVHRLADRLRIEATSPIIPWKIGGNEAVMTATDRLLEQGFYVQGIRTPTVAPGTERLRLTVSAQHTEQQIDEVVEAIKNV